MDFQFFAMQKSTHVLYSIVLVAALVQMVVWFFVSTALLTNAIIFSALWGVQWTGLFILPTSWRRLRVYEWLFLLAIVEGAAMIALNHQVFIYSPRSFEPFVGIKLASVIIAVICPPSRWVGYASYAVIVLSPLLQFGLWDPTVRARLTVQEPWVTVVFAIACFFMYLLRLQLARYNQVSLQAESRLRASQQLSHVLVGAQHLINTPLQTIEAGLLVMASQVKNEDDTKRSIDDAFDTIREINEAIRLADKNADWAQMALPGSVAELRQQLVSLPGVRSDSTLLH